MRRFAILFLLVLVSGCNDPYGNAAKLYQDVAVTIGQTSSTVDQFQKQGTVSIQEEAVILGYLGSLNNINSTYASCVKVVHKSKTAVGGFTACANTLNTSMSNPAMLAALHITSPQAQQQLQTLSSGITTLVTTTITVLGGK